MYKTLSLQKKGDKEIKQKRRQRNKTKERRQRNKTKKGDNKLFFYKSFFCDIIEFNNKSIQMPLHRQAFKKGFTQKLTA